MKFVVRSLLMCVCAFALSVASAPAAEKTFYEGKTLTFLINYAAGGPTDIEGRIVARHLARHIPGQPTWCRKTWPARAG